MKAGFEIIESAPAGGSARIYKSRHIPTGQICALKILVDGIDSNALQSEATLLNQLNHPSVVRLFKFGFLDSTAYLATHWVDGEQLADRLKRGTRFTEEQAVQLVSQIAFALQHVHECGIVHADISPANIILDNKDCVTIVDFGIGRQTSTATVTANSDLAGTLRYVAPEVIQGNKATAASDQYSVAVILYELLTGCWPYEGEATAAAALHSHLYAEPVNVQERNPAVSLGLDSVLSKCLNKDPRARFDSITDMVEALHDASYRRRYSGLRLTPRSSLSSAMTMTLRSIGLGLAAVGIVAVLTTVIWFQNVTTPQLNRSMIVSASHAAEFSPSCNMLEPPTLNNAGIVKNFYGIDGLPERISLASAGKNQWRLEIGQSNQYGLYGAMVKVQAGHEYQFSASVERNGYVHMPALRIEWLDVGYQVQSELLMEYGIDKLEDGLINMPVVEAPENAVYAVPTFYKDATEGTMTISSMFFRDVSCL